MLNGDCNPKTVQPTYDEPALEKRLTRTRHRWHRTFGDYFMRTLAVIVALCVLVIALLFTSSCLAPVDKAATADETPAAVSVAGIEVKNRLGECPLAAPQRNGTVLLLVTGIDDPARAQIQALQEAVSSYFEVNVRVALDSEYSSGLLHDVHALIVLANAPVSSPVGLRTLVAETRALGLPVIWMGLDAHRFADALGLRFAGGAPVPILAPDGARIDYNGTRLPAAGILLGRPLDTRLPPAMRALATISLPGDATRPVIVSGENLIYVGFLPFKRLEPSPILALAIHAMAEKLGVHSRDPRVILRLEDINGLEETRNAKGFAKTTSYLLEQGIFFHLAVIPEWVDGEGNVVADIGAAKNVLKLLEDHPYDVEVIQHGFQHRREDLRNAGKPSGTAHEFFFDDDETMGPDAARTYARQRLEAGLTVMQRYMPRPWIFEAPHYEMSLAEEVSARELFPVILHPLQHHGGMRTAFLFPWFTWRGGTAYGPSDVGYIAPADADRFAAILGRLETLAGVLDDPVVVVFYHPYISEIPENENDLEILVDGIRKLGYRFTSVCEELAAAQ